MHEFHVLQDYMSFIKGSGYIVAAILLIGIIPFWMYLTGGEKKRK